MLQTCLRLCLGCTLWERACFFLLVGCGVCCAGFLFFKTGIRSCSLNRITNQQVSYGFLWFPINLLHPESITGIFPAWTCPKTRSQPVLQLFQGPSRCSTRGNTDEGRAVGSPALRLETLGCAGEVATDIFGWDFVHPQKTCWDHLLG